MARDYKYQPRVIHPTNGKSAPPPFSYYGAKRKIAKKIIKMLPPHNAWVEAFCGSAAITCAKAPAPIEVINDLDDHVVTLFRQLRDHPEALQKAIELTPYAAAEFSTSRNRARKVTPLEKARRFLVSTMMTVNATVDAANNRSGFSFSQSYARNGIEARVNRWNNLPHRLARVVERLKNVRVEKRDARQLLKMFSDRPATLVYLDPPYFTKREHGYVIDANDKDFHTELLNICVKSQCMILLSGYDNELYETTLVKQAKWKKKKIKTHTRDTSGKDYARTEILWMNPAFVAAVKAKRVPIQLSAEEKKHNKINPPRPPKKVASMRRK